MLLSNWPPGRSDALLQEEQVSILLIYPCIIQSLFCITEQECHVQVSLSFKV